MNKGITVEMLLKSLKKEVDAGHGDYTVFCTDDEEGNGYHAIWYYGKTPKEMDDYERNYIEKSNKDLCLLSNKNKALYLG